MRILFLAFALFSALPVQAAEIFSISSDKAAYAVNEAATLRASVVTRPINTDYEFDIVGTLNGTPLAAERVTDFEYFSTAPNAEAGIYMWEATLVMQDKRYARDLKASITYFDGRIATIDGQLATETDPDVIASLQAQKARYLSLKAGADSELGSIRTPVKNLSLEFTVQ